MPKPPARRGLMRVTLSLPEWLVDAIDQIAITEGTSRTDIFERMMSNNPQVQQIVKQQQEKGQ